MTEQEYADSLKADRRASEGRIKDISHAFNQAMSRSEPLAIATIIAAELISQAITRLADSIDDASERSRQ